MQLRKINPFRVWFYFRQGYAVYLVFIIAVGNMMVTTYYLAIKNIPPIQAIFTGFTDWVLFVIGVGLPLAIAIGYWHVKKSNGGKI